MRGLRFLILLSLLAVLIGGSSLPAASRRSAQASASSYFPLRVGNYWIYQGPTTVTVTEQVAGPDGLSYFAVNNFLDQHTRYLRVDRAGRVYELDRESGATSVLYLLGAPVGTEWTYQPVEYGRQFCLPTTARLLSRTETVHGPAGEFHDVVQIGFASVCADGGLSVEYFAPGVGLIKRTMQSIEGPRSAELVATNLGPSSRNLMTSLTLDRTVYIQDVMPILDPQHLSSLDAQFFLRNRDAEVNFVFQGCKSATFRVIGADGKEWIQKRGDDGGCCSCASPVNFTLQGDNLLFRVRIPLVLEDGTPLPGGTYALEATLDDLSLPDMLRPSARIPFTVILIQ
ncbi:MAG TPA: hypothetical protein VFW45_11330 [Candidatus Polarisedimenticolia bacterium]|nr:hypothetical protein [Candidatus Polarisedimenticolia bacterium]